VLGFDAGALHNKLRESLTSLRGSAPEERFLPGGSAQINPAGPSFVGCGRHIMLVCTVYAKGGSRSTGESLGLADRTIKLEDRHVVREFKSGEHMLDDWLRRHSLKNQRMDSSQTYVLADGNRVLGYYSLTSGSITKGDAGSRVGEGMPPYDIPIIVLAHLAVDRSLNGRGFGGWLLRDARERCLNVADQIGVRAVLVHSLNDNAKQFYEHFGFESCPAGPSHLMLLVQDLRASKAGSA
jgi:GNAT superfamily N-acetyltransferase